jgi:pSer/pThr/pTyr-binding forkhead associated (FHA) protein
MEIILEPVEGADQGPFVLETPDNPMIEPEFLIGRSADCHVRLPSGFVSRHHCGVVVDDDARAVRIRDLGSQNGTFVNNERVKGTRPLHDGDKLVVGFIPFEVHIPADH